MANDELIEILKRVDCEVGHGSKSNHPRISLGTANAVRAAIRDHSAHQAIARALTALVEISNKENTVRRYGKPPPIIGSCHGCCFSPLIAQRALAGINGEIIRRFLP